MALVSRHEESSTTTNSVPIQQCLCLKKKIVSFFSQNKYWYLNNLSSVAGEISDLWHWSWPLGSDPGSQAPLTSWWPLHFWLFLALWQRSQNLCWCYLASAAWFERHLNFSQADEESPAPAGASQRWEKLSGCWGPLWSRKTLLWIYGKRNHKIRTRIGIVY